MTVTHLLTASEMKAIEELRKRVGADMNPEMFEDDHLFYRFLKARDFNLHLAEAMLRKHLQWRKEFSVDTILTDFTSPEALVKYFPGGLIGFDKDQCPVKYFSFGNLDPKGVRKSSKFTDMVKFVIQMTEKEMVVLKEQNKKLSKELPGSVYICDFKDFSFSVASDKKTLEHVIYLAKMYQDNYPERLKAAYIINVSPYFSLAFNIIKVFLAATIIKKIQFCSRDDVKDRLLKVINADELPVFLGGSKTDPDGNPMCETFVNHAGKIPSKYFINKNRVSLSKSDGVQKLNVHRSSFSEVEVKVNEPGSLIEWEFEIKSKDIRFGLYFKEADGIKNKMIEIVPVLRLDTEEFSETGIHKCERKGTYILLFDNSYSWIRSKELYYRVIVKSPQELEAEFGANA